MIARSARAGFVRSTAWVLVILSVLLSAFELTGRPADAQAIVVLATDDYAFDAVNAEFDITISLTTGADPAAAVQYFVRFDPEVIQPVLIDPADGIEGAPLCVGGSGATAVCGPLFPVDSLQLTTFRFAGSWDSNPDGSSQTFAVTTIPFIAVGLGVSPLAIEVTRMLSPGNEVLSFASQDGSVTIGSPDTGATATPTATPAPTATPRPTATPEPDATPGPTLTAAPTATPRPTATPAPGTTPGASATTTATPTPVVRATATTTPPPAPVVTAEALATPAPDTTALPIPTPSASPSTDPVATLVPGTATPADPDRGNRSPPPSPGPVTTRAPATEPSATSPSDTEAADDPAPDGDSSANDSESDQPASDTQAQTNGTPTAVDSSPNPSPGAATGPNTALLATATLAFVAIGGLLLMASRREDAR